MYPLLGFVAVVMWVIAGFQMTLAFWQVEPAIPSLFKDGHRTNGFAVDVYIWDRRIPDLARRRYLRSLGCFMLGAAFMSVGAFFSGDNAGAILAFAFAVAFAGGLWTRWMRYRELHGIVR
ncbi:MAG: hypothetical protein AB1586_33145 [Pseudomonadota bacterium]|jgi:hypothetical protein